MEVLCGSKEDKLWHILEKDKTYCGKGETYLHTEPIPVPKDTHLICSECLRSIGKVTIS